MNYAIYRQWYNLDAYSPSTALQYDKICVVDTEELAIEFRNLLLSELNYAREHDLIQFTSNYDGREEDIFIEQEKQPVFTSLDEIFKYPNVKIPRWL